MRTYVTGTAIFVTLVLVGSVLTMPGVADDVPLTNIALGDAHYADFNADNGSWSASPVPPPPPPQPRPEPVGTWEHGVPTSGPSAAHSGDNVWATNLDGVYNDRECSALLSPPINLTHASSASVSFMEWRHLEQTSLAWDAGMLFVTADGGETFSKVVPDIGYTSDTVGSVTRSCLDGQPSGTKGLSGPEGSAPGPGYTAVTTDLVDHLGQEVQFVIAFGSDCCFDRAGWYIDDFNVTINGTSTVEDFESGDGGFVLVSTGLPPPPPAQPLGWEWGEATTGPDTDSPLWATNLDGDYGSNECSWIESPPIDLGGPTGTGLPATRAKLAWSQWYRSSSFSAGGVVQVSTNGVNYTNIAPDGGYPGDPSGSGLDDCLEHRTQESGAMSGSLNSVGEPMVPYEVDISEFLGNTITVRFLFAVTSTTFSQEGWYVDDVSVSLAAYVGQPHLPEPPLPGGGNDAPFWSSGGTDSSWSYGVVTHDDNDSPTGDTAYGTNLDGSHNTAECSWIESPAVPGALVAANPTVTFDHWYRMAFAFSATTATGGVVLVSTDGGLTWNYVEGDDYERPPHQTSYPSLRDCLTEHGVATDVDVFTGVKTQWDQATFDLSDHVDATTSSVKVRFLFGSHTSLAYEGWYIRSVELGGNQVL